MERTYLAKLRELADICARLPRTRMMAITRITTLVELTMRYERVEFDRNLETHPYTLVDGLVQDAIRAIKRWEEIAFIEAPDSNLENPLDAYKEDMHHDLFQMLWTKFSIEEYQSRIASFEHRLKINDLDIDFFRGLRCIDFGCGHGNLCHAVLRAGADSVLGIDYGEDSIRYASEARDALGVEEENLTFRVASVYRTGEADETFDCAFQNGVFHHLDDEDAAYREVHRVLKEGGWIWIYTDGKGAISQDLWSFSQNILSDLPAAFVVKHLEYLNLGEGKRYHLGDCLNAIYRNTTWEELIERLTGLGFCDFRRLTGGMATDFDADVIAADKWGKEKFGSGTLRLMARKAS